MSDAGLNKVGEVRVHSILDLPHPSQSLAMTILFKEIAIQQPVWGTGLVAGWASRPPSFKSFSGRNLTSSEAYERQRVLLFLNGYAYEKRASH
jgi:hypothetical protein